MSLDYAKCQSCGQPAAALWDGQVLTLPGKCRSCGGSVFTAKFSGLEAEALAARKDAERYRWLKESESLVWPSVDLANACHRAQQTSNYALIDAEIDREMAWPAVGAA